MMLFEGENDRVRNHHDINVNSSIKCFGLTVAEEDTRASKESAGPGATPCQAVKLLEH